MAAAHKSGSSRAAAEAFCCGQQIAEELDTLQLSGVPAAAAAPPLPSCKQLATELRKLSLPGPR